MVYGRLITFIKAKKIALLASACLLLTSCTDTFQAPTSGKRADALSGDFYYTGKGYVYEENPIITTGNTRLSYPSMKDYVSAKVVTTNSSLQTSCDFNGLSTGDGNCFKVLNSVDSTVPLKAINGGWGYPIGSDEFYQINTFYHVNKMIERFTESLEYSHSVLYGIDQARIPTATKYALGSSRSFWFNDSTSDIFNPVANSPLKVYSKCFITPFNAYFSPAERKVCLGWNEDREWLFIAQDPSVVYHEMGHALVKVMMNQRNTAIGNFNNYNITPFKSDLGVLTYDEGASINEGVADWFSYYMNGRTHFGEWALGRFFDASRAMTEEDDIYDGLVSKESGERLAYPEYIYFDPNTPKEKHEDVHVTGQVVSHYLVSLTEELKSCSYGTSDEKHEQASNKVFLVLNETLAEIGDMTGRGSDVYDKFISNGSSYTGLGGFFSNLNSQEAYRWSHQVNPPNFRRFFQTFAKVLKHRVIDSLLCPSFTVDQSEQLLDEYGLLLFDNYGDFKKGVEISSLTAGEVAASETDFRAFFFSSYGGCTTVTPYLENFCPSLITSATQVNDLNRRNTVLVNKDLIEHITDDADISPTFIVDSKSQIESYLATLAFEGKGVQVSEGSAGVEYNNNNIKISPGEIVGVMLNLFNNSNTTIGGVQVLANDWDHMKLLNSAKTFVNRVDNTTAGNDIAHWSPCQIDGWPLQTENGQIDDDPNAPQEGDCGYTTRTNFVLHYDTTDADTNTDYPEYYADAPQPVCMVQYSGENETQWMSQDFYRKTVLDLGEDECLNPSAYSGSDFNPNECLIRFIPGADQATFGKIDPQKTYTDTIVNADTSEGLQIDYNNLLLMEVNKEVTPGTTFSCRLRARFTNCSDCYTKANGEEYSEYEMAGSKPYKIINFKFTVLQ